MTKKKLEKNYIKLNEKAVHWMQLRMETNHSDSEQGEPRIHNQRQKSWDKSSLLAFLRTRQTRIQLHLPNLGPIPNIMYKLQRAISSDFQHCIGKEEGK